ncbi:hypothetical protein [Polluticaenibacter yanchengensis]|uniref:Uncharacterized protein n=1 Tax=Polluticaenibacter yanchengensis TaxID=3014562 RepID=A0ABT4UNV9_9BACT|nr:hypothetical protein [Chitinophagaceae bacterium LY-5]
MKKQILLIVLSTIMSSIFFKSYSQTLSTVTTAGNTTYQGVTFWGTFDPVIQNIPANITNSLGLVVSGLLTSPYNNDSRCFIGTNGGVSTTYGGGLVLKSKSYDADNNPLHDYPIDFMTGIGASKPHMRLHSFGLLNLGEVETQKARAASNEGYKLLVNGAIGAKRVKVTQTTFWPDYVFESNYKLASLSEVEAFIKANKHLPDVPPAAEVEKEGLDVGDTQALLLRKIEELTLYMIELNKKVEAQSQTIQAQHSIIETLKSQLSK